MSRYIDYDAIDYRNDRLHDKSEEFLNGVIYMAQRIEDAPSIDIVRCGECKHYDTPECQIKVSLYGLNADGFCPYGEREGE